VSTLMQKLFGLGAVLDFNSRDAVARMGTAERAAGHLRKGMLDIGVGARKGAGGLAQMGIAAAPVTAVLGMGIKRAVDFEDGMARIGTLLTGSDMGQLPRIGSDLDAMTRRFGMAADVMQNAGFQALSASVPVQDLGRFLDVAARAAVGGYTQIDVAVDGLTNVLNAYEMDMDRAIEVSDAFFVANRRGKTTFAELAGTLGGVAPMAKSMGVHMQELAGVVATVTKNGITTSQTVTGLKAALTNILKPTQDAKDEAKRLGLQLGPEGIARAGGLLPYLQSIVKSEKFTSNSLNNLFGSSEALNMMLKLTSDQGLTDFAAGLQEMATGGQTESAFRLVEKTSSFQMKRMQQIGLSALRAVGAAILPVISQMLDPVSRALDSLTQSLIDPDGLGGALKSTVADVRGFIVEYIEPAFHRFAGWLADLGPETKKRLLQGVLAVGALGVAIGTVAAVLGPVVFGLGGIASAAQGAGGALAAMASPPILAAVLAVAGAGMAVADNWDYVRDSAGKFAAGFLSTMGGVAEDTKTNLLPALRSVKSTLSGIFALIIGDGAQAKSTWGEIGVAAGALVAAIGAVAEVLINVFGFAFNLIAGEIIKPFINVLKLQWSGVVDILTGKDVLGGIGRFAKGAMGLILLPFQGIVRRMLNIIASAINTINGWIGKSKFGGPKGWHPEQLPIWGNIPEFAKQFNDVYGGTLPMSYGSYAVPGAKEASESGRFFRPDKAGESGGFMDNLMNAIEKGSAKGTAAGASSAPHNVNVNLDGRAMDKAAGRRAAAERDRTGTPTSPSERAYYLRGNVLVAYGAKS